MKAHYSGALLRSFLLVASPLLHCGELLSFWVWYTGQFERHDEHVVMIFCILHFERLERHYEHEGTILLFLFQHLSVTISMSTRLRLDEYEPSSRLHAKILV